MRTTIKGQYTVLLAAFLSTAQFCSARVELMPCKNNFTPQQQIELGQKAVRQVYAQMPVLPDASPVTQYIQALGNKLTAQAPGYRWPYNFHVVNVADINAFALPGGAVFVNLGTIQAAANEAQLAGVMAHEISHVVLQHSVCNAVKQQKVGLIAGLGQIAAGVLLGGAGGQLAGEGIGLTAGLGFLKMSRGAEREADLLGVGILYDAGYDPHGMSQFFETIQAKYGRGGSQFLSDHPNPGNRTEYVDKEVSTFIPKPNYITNTPAFTRIHIQVAGMRAYTSKEIASGVWRRQDPNQTVDVGVNQVAADTASPTSADMSTSDNWKPFTGSGYSLQIPGNWQAYGDQSAASFAPSGGIARGANGGSGNVINGALTDRYQPQSAGSLDGSLDGLIGEIAHDNPGLTCGTRSDIPRSGVTGRSVECENPGANNARGEHDWIVAFPQSNSSLLRYFVFVAPTQDFERMRPIFSRILQSVDVR
jgi:beta-barrel assembly-enhancing protease